MARNMWLFRSGLVTLLTYVVVAQASEEMEAPTSSDWHRKLPTTAIPDALQNFILPFSSQIQTSELLDAIREGNKVSVGGPAKLGRKGGPDADDDESTVDPSSLANTFDYHLDYAEVAIVDPSLSAIFFPEEDVKSGTKVTLYRKVLQKSSTDSGIFFLPRPLAEAIPFSSSKLSVALDMLNISQGSPTALAMKQTLQVCERPGITGEIRFCATSLESMIDSATSTLGTSGVRVLETNVPSNLKSQRYTITGIPFRSKSGLGSVVCHRRKYPYVVYFCHQVDHTTSARVSLKGEDGISGEGVVVCHRDTSGWNPRHMAFKVLNLKPGGAPICHFLPAEHVLWIPAN